MRHFTYREGVSKTQIIRKVGISFWLPEEFIVFLLAKGHLRRELRDGLTKYELTNRDEDLLLHLTRSRDI